MVVPLAASRLGEVAGARAAAPLRTLVGEADAVLVGPGMATAPSVGALLRALMPLVAAHATLVLDGAAAVSLGAFRGRRSVDGALDALRERLIVTPHAGEMAGLTGLDKRDVEADAAGTAARAAERFGAVFVLKGADTWIADSSGTRLHHRGQLPGLGTSGSGDTLAGIVAGFAARGATPLAAAAWGVWVHAAAGRRLAARMGPVGFLARELLAEVPVVLGRLPA
jgi:NAD(P)H-hydrate repair Nnr-like enzyme with NAD(P)H-hydrate dehydratase domain